MTVSYAIPSEGSKVKHIQLRFPALLDMYCDFSGFHIYLFTILCMVLGERPKFFAILHCEIWFLICLTLLLWNLAQSDEPWSRFACKDWDAPFIPKHDTLTYYLFQNSLTWILYNLFTFILPLSKNKIGSYLQNTCTLVSDNFGNLFFVLLSIK